MNFFLAFYAASALAGGFDAETPRSPQPQAERPQAADAEVEPRRICRMSVDSASRLGRRRICLTAEQWRDRDGN